MMAACSSFTLSLNQVMVSVKVAADGTKAVASLSDIWVLLVDVSSGLRNVRFMMSFGELIGKRVTMDEPSLDPRSNSLEDLVSQSGECSWLGYFLPHLRGLLYPCLL